MFYTLQSRYLRHIPCVCRPQQPHILETVEPLIVLLLSRLSFRNQRDLVKQRLGFVMVLWWNTVRTAGTPFCVRNVLLSTRLALLTANLIPVNDILLHSNRQFDSDFDTRVGLGQEELVFVAVSAQYFRAFRGLMKAEQKEVIPLWSCTYRRTLSASNKTTGILCFVRWVA